MDHYERRIARLKQEAFNREEDSKFLSDILSKVYKSLYKGAYTTNTLMLSIRKAVI